MRDLIPEDSARTVISWAALASMVLVAVLLVGTLPRPPQALGPSPGGFDVNRQNTARDGYDPRPDAICAAAVLSLAWLVMAPYVLPWYALFAWVPVALLAASSAGRLLLGWTTALSVAYASAVGRSVYLRGSRDILDGWIRRRR